MLVKGFWTFLRAFKCWILVCAPGTWDCSLCTSSLHISRSWRVGLFPWHFAVCSLHFAQQLFPFLPPSVGLSSSHTWDGAVVELLWLPLCSYLKGKWNLWLPRSWPRTQMMRSHFGFPVWSSAISPARKEMVSFPSSAGWFLWFRNQKAGKR